MICCGICWICSKLTRYDVCISEMYYCRVDILTTEPLPPPHSRASAKQLKIETQLTDLYNDVLKPVDSMLYRRGNSSVEFQLECEPNLIVMTDKLRLNQIMLNLCRNSQKFVEQGFIRLTAHTTGPNGTVRLCVEDSGPGIPVEKRKFLFRKFQESLDTVAQGEYLRLLRHF